MFSTSDTIVAIATPPGRGGIGVVRISGPDAEAIARKLVARDAPLVPRHATFAVLHSNDHTLSDEVIAIHFAAPHSYTGEHVVEISAHGSPVILREIVAAAMSHGARLAEPGEFTLRAFLNGRMDLVQAEAVADLIDAVTPLQARAAFDQLQGTLTRAIADVDAALFDLIARLEASVDFPDEGYHFAERTGIVKELDALREKTASLLADAARGRLVREGLQVALVGKPNVGKSSLFNRLVGAERAIVTEAPGTTRDLVTERVDINGLLVTLVDTAGRREAVDAAEAEGVARSEQAQQVADLVIVVLDGSQPLDASDLEIISQTTTNKRLIVSNKADVGASLSPGFEESLWVSATTGAGLDRLRAAVTGALDVDLLADRPAMTNLRHVSLVTEAHEALGRARRAAGTSDGSGLSEEFVLADLQIARRALEEITGQRTTDDMLSHIFSRFCVGK